ncbi:hypothetical protein H7R52_12930 [Weissella confusa]|uniref:Ribosome biogenesis GTPase RsgA N-terminal domain-containing protein n=1 Tax=Weissella confusa TaxID=1583 RepID=A0A923SNP9_WEICO|nr:hypothetical protein [Weissella confusa]
MAGFYDVLTDDGELFRTRARGNFRKRDMKPLVGDWVTFSADSQSEGYILDIDERDNSLVRPPVHHRLHQVRHLHQVAIQVRRAQTARQLNLLLINKIR